MGDLVNTDGCAECAEKLDAAQRAVKHLLERIKDDQPTRYQIGFGTQSYELQTMVTCDCSAGYGQNHSLYCALVKDDSEDCQALDYPRSAISEAIASGIE